MEDKSEVPLSDKIVGLGVIFALAAGWVYSSMHNQPDDVADIAQESELSVPATVQPAVARGFDLYK